MHNIRPASWPVVFAAFASVDLALIALHAADRLFNVGLPWWMHVTPDRGLPESLNYAKWAATAMLLAARHAQDRRPVHGVLSMVFVVILLDDALSLHEAAGGVLSRTFGLPPLLGVSGQDLGELAVFLAEGVLVLSVVCIAWRRGGPGDGALLRFYLLLLAALACCSVLFDALHAWSVHRLGPDDPRFLAYVLGAAEDGGEMLVASLILAVTLTPPAKFCRKAPARVATRPA